MRFHLLLLACAHAYTPTPHGALVQVGDLFLELAVEGLTSFRVSLLNGSAPAQQATSMVAAKSAWAPFTVLTPGTLVNVTAPGLGSLAVDTATGALTLCDAAGGVLAASSAPPARAAAAWPHLAGGLPPPPPRLGRNDTCPPRQAGVDVSGPVRSDGFPNGLSGQSEDQCCAACNSDSSCISWVWSDGSRPDPAGNCWPLKGYSGTHAQAGRVLGGFAPPPPPPPPGTTVFQFSVPPGAVFLGAGTDGGGATTLARSGAQAQVFNTGSWTPSFHCTAGWSMMAVSAFSSVNPRQGSGVYPVSWAAGGGSVQINVLGGDAASGGVDLYLMPAASLRQHVMAQADLQGHAAVPPRFALGFLACRWGWTDQKYIEGVLQEFRAGHFPADAFISDFEWFTARPDYTLPPQGDPLYHDFLFNNITFPDPAAAYLTHYRADLNFRFGGIRKPRLGNSALLVSAQQQGWLMGQGGDPSGTPNGSRNTNYSDLSFRAWYSHQDDLFLRSGVRFFWNDEGEDDFFTFTDWSLSQLAGQLAFNSTLRYFSINRAFSYVFRPARPPPASPARTLTPPPPASDPIENTAPAPQKSGP